MEQVSGRAGRKDGRGKVIVQVANVSHPVLAFVKAHNYNMFFEQEIPGRQKFFYPPFSRIVLLTFKHKVKEVVDSAARLVANNMKFFLEKFLVGPGEPVVNRVRNQYLMELLIKLPKDSSTMQLAKQVIQQQIIILNNNKKFRSVVIVVDVDSI